jgi:hypothetical protein
MRVLLATLVKKHGRPSLQQACNFEILRRVVNRVGHTNRRLVGHLSRP